MVMVYTGVITPMSGPIQSELFRADSAFTALISQTSGNKIRLQPIGISDVVIPRHFLGYTGSFSSFVIGLPVPPMSLSPLFIAFSVFSRVCRAPFFTCCTVSRLLFLCQGTWHGSTFCNRVRSSPGSVSLGFRSDSAAVRYGRPAASNT